jgi:hypothetical protein
MKKLLIIAAIAAVFAFIFMKYENIKSTIPDPVNQVQEADLQEKTEEVLEHNGAVDDQAVMMEVMKNMHGSIVDITAKTLNISTDELRKLLKEGNTFKGIAIDNGVKPELLVENLKKLTSDHTAQLVNDGKLTEGQAKMINMFMFDRIEVMINSDDPKQGLSL